MRASDTGACTGTTGDLVFLLPSFLLPAFSRFWFCFGFVGLLGIFYAPRATPPTTRTQIVKNTLARSWQ